jgi:regulator of replication initiation timing
MPSPETLYAELQNLRKKYDAVVEYTVHLTAERDTVVQRLEEAERELARETTRRRSQQAETPRGTSRVEKSVEKKNIQKVPNCLSVCLSLVRLYLSLSVIGSVLRNVRTLIVSHLILAGVFSIGGASHSVSLFLDRKVLQDIIITII